MIYGLLRIVNSSNPFELLDDIFFNKKINCFDTANCYGNSETIFGNWMISRNINRSDIHIICKGGHHVNHGDHIIHRITKENILHDLYESFKRLQITYADTFMFHRDDENVSPQTIYEISHSLLSSNLCKKIGVSNWKTSRIQEVNNISPILTESQVFLNYIKLPFLPYPNIHTINHSDYIWYKNHPEHKIQIYSVACFTNELNNTIYQNKIFKQIVEYLCDITRETKQTMLYVLLSKCTGLNTECIHGSINVHHILNESKIDEIYEMIKDIPNLDCFIVDHPTDMNFLTNGFIGPFPLKNIENIESIDSITNWVLEQRWNNYEQMKHHHENNSYIKKICMDPAIHDIVTKYIGYECICYNTEFFLRKNNNDFAYTSNWHIDPYLNLDDTYPHFTLQIGFTDNNENNALSIIAGSHIIDYQNTYTMMDKNNFAPLVPLDDSIIDPSLVHKLLNKKGYVYLFSNYVTHGRGVFSDSVRLALTLRIVSKESSIKTKIDSYISKDIFTLGNSNESLFSNVFWNTIQQNRI